MSVEKTLSINEVSIISILTPNEKENERRKLRKENFLRKAKIVHGDRYDYSKSIYKSAHLKIRIKCSKHGYFYQLPTNHIDRKQGCPKCEGHNRTTSEFIKMAKVIHGNLYDYSKTKYHHYDEKLVIVCKSHGPFKQSPNKHLGGRGCPICANNVTLTLKQFVERAKKIHEEKYFYDKVEYNNLQKKVCIGCKLHGDFYQSPIKHMSGQGCRKCALDPQLNHKGFRRKLYQFSDGRIEKVQGYESLTIDFLLSQSIKPEEIILSGPTKPIIQYQFSGSIRDYFPDCYLPNSNTIVETKSTWTWELQKYQNLSKISASLNSGHNVRMITWNGKHNLVSDITYS